MAYYSIYLSLKISKYLRLFYFFKKTGGEQFAKYLFFLKGSIKGQLPFVYNGIFMIELQSIEST
ncbi:hypothetical protein [Aneurinibacillus terranovensis]|uniref:hypothetical protein n=1 Tax=Aneurinibacillus terranovensis TaxID=278991 RepID=UPI00048016F4